MSTKKVARTARGGIAAELTAREAQSVAKIAALLPGVEAVPVSMNAIREAVVLLRKPARGRRG
jgi:hypothetical protein